MIKKISVVLVLGLIGVSLWFLLTPSNMSDKTEIYLVTESRFILNEENESLKIHYFAKTEEYNLFSEDDIIYLHNEDETIKFIVELIEIKSFHNEMLLDEIFYGYEVLLTLPSITDCYYIDACYVSFDHNDRTYRFFIGELYVEYQQVIHNLPFQGLEGIKSDTPKLSQIIVNITDDVDISEMWIGPYDISFFMADDLLVCNLPEMTYLFWDTYVKIVTNDGVFYLPQFSYFINYELLSFGIFERYVI